MADSDITILPVNRQSFASRASHYIEQFIPVFPCRPDRRPYTANGFHDASFDPAIVSAWSRAWPDALVGVPMGRASGLWALDVDMKKGRDGFASLASLDLDLPITRRYRTTSGGEHVLFRYPAGVDLRSTAGKLGEGLDTRGEGGYVVDWSLEGLPCEHPDALADIPPALLARLLASPGDVERVAPGAHELTGREARALLAVLDPDMDYSDWVKVGQALHYDSGGSSKALALWEAWSAKGEKWEEGVTAAKWRSFHLDRAGPVVGAGTLRMMARAADVDMDFDDLADAPDTGEERFIVETFDAARVVSDIPWLIRELLPLSGVGMIFGDSGSGKTFMALDLALSVARGEPWRGLQVEKRRVLYVAAEGGVSFSHRLEAYARFHGVTGEDLDFSVIRKEAPNFSDAVDVKWILRRAQEGEPCGLIVIDTLAQVTPGCDENAVKDMGVIMRRCTQLAALTGSLVLLIHHSGKDPGRGARGSSAIRGALDFEACVTRKKDGEEGGDDKEGVLKITKQRAGEAGRAWAFKLESVEVHTSLDTGPIRSCVVVPAVFEAKRKKGRPDLWGDALGVAVEENREAWALGVDRADVVEAMVEVRGRVEEQGQRWASTARARLTKLLRHHFKEIEGVLVPLESGEELGND